MFAKSTLVRGLGGSYSSSGYQHNNNKIYTPDATTVLRLFGRAWIGVQKSLSLSPSNVAELPIVSFAHF